MDVSIKTTTKTINVDQHGDSPINEVILGRTLTVKCPFSEADLDTFYALMKPSGATLAGTAAAGSGSIQVKSAPADGDTLKVNGLTITFASPATADNFAGAVVYIDGTVNTAANMAMVIGAHATDVQATVSNDTVLLEGDNDTALNVTGTFATADSVVISMNNNGSATPGKRKVTISANAGLSLFKGAQELVLHPTNLPDNDRSEDFTVPLASLPGSLDFAYRFDTQRIYTGTFTGYVDPQTDVLCYMGDTTI